MPGQQDNEEVMDDTTRYQRGTSHFYQLMLPLCDTTLSGILEGKWLPYYSEVEKWSNIYSY